jgi:SAM-dependent methyltransferase
MTEYSASTYGDQIVDVYDALFGDYDSSAITLLADLAGDGPALELGIGTGRLALPLAERGVAVQGIDASAAMIEKLRTKLGGASIRVAVGDFSNVALEERFSLIFVAFNTFFALQTQEDQVRCFRSVASHLREGGTFLIEAFVPISRALIGGNGWPYRELNPAGCGLKRHGMNRRRNRLILSS